MISPEIIRIGLNAAIAEAEAGWSQGGIPIGSALLDDQARVVASGHNMRVRKRTWVHTSCNKTRNVRDVRHKQRANFVGNSAKARKINHAGIGGIAANNHLWLALHGGALNGVVVKQFSFWIKTVLGDFIKRAGEIWLESVA